MKSEISALGKGVKNSLTWRQIGPEFRVETEREGAPG